MELPRSCWPSVCGVCHRDCAGPAVDAGAIIALANDRFFHISVAAVHTVWLRIKGRDISEPLR